MTAFDRVTAALRAVGCEPRRSGDGWTCRCPAHDDSAPSLSIGLGAEARVLLHCHAGCETPQILAAIALDERDLFEAGATPPTTRPPATTSDPTPAHPSPQAAVAAFRAERPSRIWQYRSADGVPVGAVARWDARGGKTIRPFRRDSDGWRAGAMPEPRPLYRLPELVQADDGATAFVVEGEKCVDAAVACGLLATTSPGGAKAAAKADWVALRGRSVVVLPDRDRSGEAYAKDVARLALEAGARSVRIVRLEGAWPDLPEGGDLHDLLDRFEGDPDATRAAVERLVADAKPTLLDALGAMEAGRPRECVRVAPLPGRPRLDTRAVFPKRIACVRGFVDAVAESTQTPAVMPALLALGVASACVAGVAVVRGHGDHVEPAPIWSLVLADSASRKSATVAELVAPVVAWERRRAAQMAPEIAIATQRRRIMERQLKELESIAARPGDPKAQGASEQAGELAARLAEEVTPTAPRLLTCEPTPEALGEQMAANGGRALVASAESGLLDIARGLYSGAANFDLLLKGHAGDAVRAPRIGREGTMIDRPAIAMALCVQPEAVRSLWSDRLARGRGLLARFALALPEDRVGSREVRPKPVDAALRKGWEDSLARLLSFEPREEPLVVTLGSDADAAYLDFQREVEASLGSGDLAENRAFGGKLCGLALRIALTLHALGTWAALPGRPEDFPTIDLDTMRGALAWARFLAQAERHARTHLLMSEAEQEWARIAEWIGKRGEPVTARDVARGIRSFASNTAAAETTLRNMVQRGLLIEQERSSGPSGGRPTVAYAVADASFVDAEEGSESPLATPQTAMAL